jgi:hypothetical protein
VAIAKEGQQQLLHHLFLPDDDLSHLLLESMESGAKSFERR